MPFRISTTKLCLDCLDQLVRFLPITGQRYADRSEDASQFVPILRRGQPPLHWTWPGPSCESIDLTAKAAESSHDVAPSATRAAAHVSRLIASVSITVSGLNSPPTGRYARTRARTSAHAV